jgi:hypothetical protein
MPGLDDLSHALAAATGADPAIDRTIEAVLGGPAAAYTASVEDCRRLVAARLPDARLHVGYSVSGVFPYAAVTRGAQRSTAEAPTVPLAILRALTDAVRA